MSLYNYLLKKSFRLAQLLGKQHKTMLEQFNRSSQNSMHLNGEIGQIEIIRKSSIDIFEQFAAYTEGAGLREPLPEYWQSAIPMGASEVILEVALESISILNFPLESNVKIIAQYFQFSH